MKLPFVHKGKNMRLISYFLAIFLIIWSAFWWISAEQVERTILNWFDQNSSLQKGSHNKVSTAGYPNRVDVTIDNFFVVNEEAKLSISAEFIQLLRLVYNKNHLVAIAKPPIQLDFNNLDMELTGPLIKSSLKINLRPELTELISEGENLKLTTSDNTIWTVKNLLLATTKLSPQTYKAHLALNGIAFPNDSLVWQKSFLVKNHRIEKFLFDGIFKISTGFFDKSNYKKEVELRDLHINIGHGLVNLNINGSVQVSRYDFLEGSFTINLQNWRRILSIIEKEEFLEKKLSKKIKGAITFIASQSDLANKDVLLPITIKNGQIFLGPLEITKFIKLDILTQLVL